MSNIEIIIEERAANIGNFMVGRLLPFRQKRMVGPFTFIDHMGPATFSPEENFDVGPHPHIGLSTLTYLFDGAIMHRDSLGTEMEIRPGAVNWMTAGKGVVHSERTPERLRNKEKSMHGLQIWVALPRSMEHSEPQFQHVEESLLPTWEEDGVHFRLVAGEAFGKKSPVAVHSPLYFIEIKARERKQLDIGRHLFGESALYILEGKVYSEGNTFEPRQILVAKDSSLCSFEIEAGTSVYIFGGEPFAEERYIDWNFVASSKERLAEAREDWKAGRFPQIPGESDLVPYPDRQIRS